MSPLTYCENDVADAILRHFAALASQEGISFKVDVGIPETLPIDNADISIVISNLLENALEACSYVTGTKNISITMKQIKNELIILVDNSFDGNVMGQGDGFLSRKGRNRRGVGLDSGRAVAVKYGGSAEFKADTQDKVFHSVVIMGSVLEVYLLKKIIASGLLSKIAESILKYAVIIHNSVSLNKFYEIIISKW